MTFKWVLVLVIQFTHNGNLETNIQQYDIKHPSNCLPVAEMVNGEITKFGEELEIKSMKCEKIIVTKA